MLDAIQATDALGLAGSLTNLAYSFEACSGEAEGEIKEPQQCPLCFAAGTPVHTNHGDVLVQDIKVGDEVLSEDAKTGKTEYQPVMALTHPHLDRLLEIRIEGEAEPLRPSTGHPFWTRSAESDAGRWVKAGDLRAGDFLETPAGGWRRVVSVTALPGEQTVYNFTVDQDHDYFVGETGFLVHNTECPCNLRYTDRMSNTQYRKLVKDIGENGIQNKLINYVSIGEDNYVLWGNNRLMAARRLGLVDQLEFQEVQLPFQGFQTEEDVINSAANFYSGGSCIY